MTMESRADFDLSQEEMDGALYVAPTGVLGGAAADAIIASGHGRRLAGSRSLAFGMLDVSLREGGRMVNAAGPIAEIMAWAEKRGPAVKDRIDMLLARIEAPRAPFAELSMDRPRIMGIVNVTPDSFSDGGDHADPDSAILHGRRLLEAGADILDIGGESSRPGAPEMDPEKEAARVVPVVRALAGQGAAVSVDTRHALVMAESIAAGATIINDISALEGEGALEAVARTDASVVLMHMKGAPESMQDQPRYDSAPLEVYDYLQKRLQAALAAGIPPERLSIDPGIGFGKTVRHNIQILSHLALYHSLSVPLLLGVSRKSFIASLSRGEAPKDRLAGSIAVAVDAMNKGAQILRVHDAAETSQALAIWSAINQRG